MKQQAFNPYLPGWEYIPDGEPHIFGDRVHIWFTRFVRSTLFYLKAILKKSENKIILA